MMLNTLYSGKGPDHDTTFDDRIDYLETKKSIENPVNRIRFNQINDPFYDDGLEKGVPV